MSVDAWDHSEQGCRGEGVEASNGAVGAVVGLPSQSPPRRRRSPGSCSGSGAGSSCVGACRSAWWAFWNSPELWWRPDDQVGVLFGLFTVNRSKGSCAVCCDERARSLRRPPAPLPRRAALRRVHTLLSPTLTHLPPNPDRKRRWRRSGAACSRPGASRPRCSHTSARRSTRSSASGRRSRPCCSCASRSSSPTARRAGTSTR